jgi:hypothetical protein
MGLTESKDNESVLFHSIHISRGDLMLLLPTEVKQFLIKVFENQVVLHRREQDKAVCPELPL